MKLLTITQRENLDKFLKSFCYNSFDNIWDTLKRDAIKNSHVGRSVYDCLGTSLIFMPQNSSTGSVWARISKQGYKVIQICETNSKRNYIGVIIDGVWINYKSDLSRLFDNTKTKDEINALLSSVKYPETNQF